jgi:hypothetical protein
VDLGVVCVLPVKAQYQGSISINADGSIEPSTAPIVCQGNVHTLTENISGSMIIHRSNIVIDGAGYTLYGNGGTGIDLTNDSTKSPSPQNIWDVTIENLAILGFHFGINTNGGGNDTFYDDYIVTSMYDNAVAISFWGCGGNIVSYCSLIGDSTVTMQLNSSNNTITENNIAGSVWVEIAGDEMVDRNYWSDYLTIYPNATEIDNTGIGDTPYVFYSYSNSVSGARTQTPLYDYHPLINSVNIPSFPTSAATVASTIPSSTPASTSPSPTPTSPSPTPTAPEFPSIFAILIVFIAVSLSIAVLVMARSSLESKRTRGKIRKSGNDRRLHSIRNGAQKPSCLSPLWLRDSTHKWIYDHLQ